ncbi:hypothetical protein EW026_g3897 [Hermanssonia centrifuga]|uniref:Uncharacterized protein n=1 Tax=Hermanssonia centrifuga TaxID=98765 RepID=A0A4V3XAN6_9APHY|nr:hypothetical protein EW026_g3897 [Hermanssonia centrifuga]
MSKNAVYNNEKLFPLFRENLRGESLKTYEATADKLKIWLSKDKAYYDSARPWIIEFLESALGTVIRHSGLQGEAPFHISLCPPGAKDWVIPYVTLVRAAANFHQYFPESHLRARLEALIRTVFVPPPVTTPSGPSMPPITPPEPFAGPSFTVIPQPQALYDENRMSSIPRISRSSSVKVKSETIEVPVIAHSCVPIANSSPSTVGHSQALIPSLDAGELANAKSSPDTYSLSASTHSSLPLPRRNPKPKHKSPMPMTGLEFLEEDLKWFQERNKEAIQEPQANATDTGAGTEDQALATKDEEKPPKVEEGQGLGGLLLWEQTDADHKQSQTASPLKVDQPAVSGAQHTAQEPAATSHNTVATVISSETSAPVSAPPASGPRTSTPRTMTSETSEIVSPISLRTPAPQVDLAARALKFPLDVMKKAPKVKSNSLNLRIQPVPGPSARVAVPVTPSADIPTELHDPSADSPSALRSDSRPSPSLTPVEATSSNVEQAYTPPVKPKSRKGPPGIRTLPSTTPLSPVESSGMRQITPHGIASDESTVVQSPSRKSKGKKGPPGFKSFTELETASMPAMPFSPTSAPAFVSKNEAHPPFDVNATNISTRDDMKSVAKVREDNAIAKEELAQLRASGKPMEQAKPASSPNVPTVVDDISEVNFPDDTAVFADKPKDDVLNPGVPSDVVDPTPMDIDETHVAAELTSPAEVELALRSPGADDDSTMRMEVVPPVEVANIISSQERDMEVEQLEVSQKVISRRSPEMARLHQHEVGDNENAPDSLAHTSTTASRDVLLAATLQVTTTTLTSTDVPMEPIEEAVTAPDVAYIDQNVASDTVPDVVAPIEGSAEILPSTPTEGAQVGLTNSLREQASDVVEEESQPVAATQEQIEVSTLSSVLTANTPPVLEGGLLDVVAPGDEDVLMSATTVAVQDQDIVVAVGTIPVGETIGTTRSESLGRLLEESPTSPSTGSTSDIRKRERSPSESDTVRSHRRRTLSPEPAQDNVAFPPQEYTVDAFARGNFVYPPTTNPEPEDGEIANQTSSPVQQVLGVADPVTAKEVSNPNTQEERELGELTPMVSTKGLDQNFDVPPSPPPNDTHLNQIEKGKKKVVFEFEISAEHHHVLTQWSRRYNIPDDMSSGKCLSLACYRFMDCISAIDEDSTLSSPQKLFLGCKPTGWPYQDWIWVKINDPSADDTKMQFLVYPFSLNKDKLLDISGKIQIGKNRVEINDPYGDTFDYVFTLQLHTPTSSQLAELRKRRDADQEWQDFLQECSKITIPPIVWPPEFGTINITV